MNCDVCCTTTPRIYRCERSGENYCGDCLGLTSEVPPADVQLCERCPQSEGCALWAAVARRVK